MVFEGVSYCNTKAGLKFEENVDLSEFLNSQKGYRVEEENVFYKDELVGNIFKKHSFYKFLEDELQINWKNLVSKRLLLDDVFIILSNTYTIYIIECKFNKSVDSDYENLQKCDFKRKQYQKLLAPANIEVEYVYLLSDWFRKPEYKDVLDYIQSVYCHYYFEYIPLTRFGLPVPE